MPDTWLENRVVMAKPAASSNALATADLAIRLVELITRIDIAITGIDGSHRYESPSKIDIESSLLW